MTASKSKWTGIALLAGVVFAVTYFRVSPTSAQEPTAAVDPAVAFARAVQTQVVTLKVEDQHGEPQIITGVARFDRPVLAYWVSVVGADVQFSGSIEKQVNRQLFGVEPFAKVINSREVEVSGRIGIRDGSGKWDDGYEGTLTISVTAVLASR